MGTEDLPNTENSKFLAQKGVVLDNAMIDADQRAVCVAFQTWVMLVDQQVMVDLTNGRIFSHDHGDCFGDTSAPDNMPLIVCSLNGVDSLYGAAASSVARAVERVESCSDEELLAAVANVPDEWGADPTRRLSIARWLVHRRGKIKEVMKAW